MKNSVFLILLFFSTHSFATNHPCFQHIKQSTCLIEKEYKYDESLTFIENHKAEMSQACLSDSQSLAREIEDVFWRLPEHSKNAFCHIKKIFIVPGEVSYGGRAGVSYETENLDYIQNLTTDDIEYLGRKPNGLLLYLSHKYRFILQESEAEFLTRTTHEGFGIDVFKDGLSNELPQWTYVGKDAPSALSATILHEVGHFIHFIEDYTGPLNFNPETKIASNNSKWFGLAWRLTMNEEGSPQQVPRVSSTLMPSKNNYPIENWPSVVKELNLSPFASFYSLLHIHEDFAEHYRSYHIDGVLQLRRGRDVFISSNNRPSENYHAKNDIIKSIPSDIFSKVYDLPTIYHQVGTPQNQPQNYLPHCKHPR